MSAPNLTWVFEATDDIARYTSKQQMPAPVSANLDDLVTKLSDIGYTNIRLDHKEWERWAWPGGYPLYYICADGGVLCSKCANAEIEFTAAPDAETMWRLDAVEINYEDDHLVCCHCGQHIESAYGEPAFDVDDSDDGAALASAGHGTDEDYGSAEDML